MSLILESAFALANHLKKRQLCQASVSKSYALCPMLFALCPLPYAKTHHSPLSSVPHFRSFNFNFNSLTFKTSVIKSG